MDKNQLTNVQLASCQEPIVVSREPGFSNPMTLPIEETLASKFPNRRPCYHCRHNLPRFMFTIESLSKGIASYAWFVSLMAGFTYQNHSEFSHNLMKCTNTDKCQSVTKKNNNFSLKKFLQSIKNVVCMKFKLKQNFCIKRK